MSVVIPARNEAIDIEACLAAVLAQDWPLGSLEVLVVDGSSTDETADLARCRLVGSRVARGEVIDNPVATTPSNLNIGLTAAKGSFVCRVDARSLIPTGYVRRCVEVLSTRPEVAVTGGRQVAVASSSDAKSKGIARGLNNRYTMGMSRYRRGADSGQSDTVYLGFFRADHLRAVGGWDERLTTNQDFDLNRRVAARGIVWFDASLEVGYIPRSTFGALFDQYRRFGAAKVAYWRMTGDRPRPRQWVAMGTIPVAVATGAGLLALTPRRLRRRVAITGLLAGGTIALMLEHLGSGAPANVPTRVASLTTAALVTTGWSLGTWSTAIRMWTAHE